MNKSISDLQLEQYILGELPPDKMKQLDKDRENNPELEKRIKAIESSSEDILSMYSPEYFGTLVRQKGMRQEKQSPFLTKERVRTFVWVFGSAAVFSLVLILLYPTMLTKPITYDFLSDNGETRIKGVSSLLVYRRDGLPILSGDRAGAGDNLQLYYRNDNYRYGAVISVDGRGVITRHYPLGSDKSATLKSGERTILPHSYELDDAPGFEIFYFFYSDKAFDITSVEESLRMSFTNDVEKMKAVNIQQKNIEYSTVFIEKK